MKSGLSLGLIDMYAKKRLTIAIDPKHLLLKEAAMIDVPKKDSSVKFKV